MAVTTTAAAAPTLTVRARGSLYDGVGPVMVVRVDNKQVGSVEVRNTAEWADYAFSASALHSGSKIEVAFVNDIAANGVDRNLFIASISDGTTVMLPSAANAVFDKGAGAMAFDGLSLTAGGSTLASNGALRLIWPAAPTPSDAILSRRKDAARFLMQASFGPTATLLDTLAVNTFSNWIETQMSLPVSNDYVNAVQARYKLGDAYRPHGAQYDPTEVGRTFWRTATTAPDPLRKRTAFALHHLFMVSQTDANLWFHGRAYAAYLDLLNRHAFGNFRTLLEEIALSPAMGIYLSHMRNRMEDPTTGRMPDENFARELMQLFTIGLQELNLDGTPRLDSAGRPIETYRNADVMALAKVFTGYAWAFPSTQLTEDKFRWGEPDYSAALDLQIDLQRMKAYPGQHSTAEKKLFTGKVWAVTLPAGATATADVKMALDALFKHPNVGPFVGRQLIQQLVSSHPSPAYVARVATVFNNNGSGVRGDLGAVVRAILMDAEARTVPAATSTAGKLREPVLGLAHWMRAFGAKTSTGQYNFGWQIEPTGQTPFMAASVFGYFRPAYVPPNTSFALRKANAPEFQLVNESTVAGWANLAESLGSGGPGWVNNSPEVTANYSSLLALITTGNVTAMVNEIDLLLFGAQMSAELRKALIEAVVSVEDNGTPQSRLDRVHLAVFLAMASPEYQVQR